jgi:mRNA interferase RelE/StbE
MYRVFLERAAEKDLRNLPIKLHNRIIVAIQALAKEPRPFGCRKLTGADDDWRIRVGDHRIVYEIDDGSKVIRVNRVRHQREVYRK